MAGTLTVAYGGEKKLQTVTVDWTSDASGDADVLVYMEGAIVRVVTNPGATAPSANYDITLVDADGFDLASSNLLNRHTSTTEQWIPTAYPFHTPSFTFTVANAGDSKIGTCTLYIAWA